MSHDYERRHERSSAPPTPETGAGHAFVLGVDPHYIATFKRMFDECERLYHAAQVIERQFNATPASGRGELGQQLDAAKTKLRTLVEELVSLQAGSAASLADANAQIMSLNQPFNGTVARSEVNALSVQWPLITAWMTYVGAPATGTPVPSFPTSAPTTTTPTTGR